MLETVLPEAFVVNAYVQRNDRSLHRDYQTVCPWASHNAGGRPERLRVGECVAFLRNRLSGVAVKKTGLNRLVFQ